MIWVWCGCLPVTFLNATDVNPGLNPRDIAGLIMFVVGFYFECVGDIQKDIFKVHNPFNPDHLCFFFVSIKGLLTGLIVSR